MSEDTEEPQGPQCDGYDSDRNLRCTSTKTKLYHLPGKPVHLQKRWFCQPHGTMIAPSGGGILGEDGKLRKAVSWKGSGVVYEKLPSVAELKAKPEPEAEAARAKKSKLEE